MAKSTTLFMCNNCGNEFPKWVGKCPACGEWNTLTEVTSFTKTKTSKNKHHQNITTITPEKALTSQKNYTYGSTITELDRVLGPGFTKGGVYLIAGQPGIGKSTLLTQLAINLGHAQMNNEKCVVKESPAQPDKMNNEKYKMGNILYVCSEENPSQVATRISRLTKQNTSHIQLLNTSSINQIINTIQQSISNEKCKMYNLVIVDSIQSVYLEDNPATAGSITQIRDSASFLIQTAKDTNIPIILVGHVTKDGNLAGPKLLEHMVDTVLELSGDRQNLLRFLRSHKNRFGPTDETGIFIMTSNGLEEVKDPSRLLLEDRLENTPGSVLTLVMEGTRPITIEVQALVVPTSIPIPRRIAKGISISRLQLLCAILTKHLHLPLGDKDVFVNITGGMNITEPGVDLGIALAIISSTKDKPLPANSICFGEVGLLGEIRKVTFQDKRLKEAKALGYDPIIAPHSFKHLRQIDIANKTPRYQKSF